MAQAGDRASHPTGRVCVPVPAGAGHPPLLCSESFSFRACCILAQACLPCAHSSPREGLSLQEISSWCPSYLVPGQPHPSQEEGGGHGGQCCSHAVPSGAGQALGTALDRQERPRPPEPGSREGSIRRAGGAFARSSPSGEHGAPRKLTITKE